MSEFIDLTLEGMKSSKDETLVRRHFMKFAGILEVRAIKELDKLEIYYDPDVVSIREPLNSLKESMPFRLIESEF